MPTDNDRASASIRFEGEARRMAIRRPRLERDGLYLFGRRYAAQTVTIEGAEWDAMVRGRTIAIDVSNEYILYLRLDVASVEPAAMPAEARRCSQIPQRQDPNRSPSERVRAVAARVRVNADRRMGVRNTPQWIVDLANSEQIHYPQGDVSMLKPLSVARGVHRMWRNWRANMEQRRGNLGGDREVRSDRTRR